MLNPQSIYEIEIANFAYGEYAKNHQISSEELQKLISKKLFEDELVFHIEQYNQNDDRINDELRNNLKQLEVDCHRINDEYRPIYSEPVEEYKKKTQRQIQEEFYRKKLHIIEDYDKKTRQTARKHGFFYNDKYNDFQAQLKDKKKLIQEEFNKLEQVAKITIVENHGHSSVANINQIYCDRD